MTGQAGQHVFISYSREDKAIASRIANYLRKHHYTVWIDLDGIVGGDVFPDELGDAIERAFALLVLVSPASDKSQWVSREILYAENQHVRIIPLKIEPCKIDLQLSHLHYIDFIQQDDAAYTALLRAIKKAAPKPVAKPEPTAEGPWYTDWLGEHQEAVAQVSYSPKGAFLVAAGGYAKTTRIWDMSGGKNSASTRSNPRTRT